MTGNLPPSRDDVRINAYAALGDIRAAIQEAPGSPTAKVLVKFVASCYRSNEYPFVLSELKQLPPKLVHACLDYLVYDSASLQPIEHRLDGGAALIDQWIVTYDIQAIGLIDAKNVVFKARLAGFASDPGYRHCRTLYQSATPNQAKRNIEVALTPDDTLALYKHLTKTLQMAWLEGAVPFDIKPGERKPANLTEWDYEAR